MSLQLYSILPALQPYVKVICAMEVDSDEAARVIRVLPDTCVELFISYKEIPLAVIGGKTVTGETHSLVTFRMDSYMDVQMEAGSGCIAVCFHAGAAAGFFPQAMDGLSNEAIVLGDVWGRMALILEEQITLAANNEERSVIIQQYLLSLLRRHEEDKVVKYCLLQVNTAKGWATAVQLAAETGMSQRQLGRRFNKTVGLSPKEYLRINRFLHSLSLIKTNPSLSLTEVAYESGYYDQAHFIHDCKDYSGCSPKALKGLDNNLGTYLLF